MKNLCLLVIAFALHIQVITAQEISLEFQNVHAHGRAFTFYNESEFIKVGEDGLISKTYDGGNTFEIYWHNNKNELLDIEQTPYGTFICGKGGTILQSTDKGITWKSLPNSGGDFHYIYQVNEYIMFLDSSNYKINFYNPEREVIEAINIDEKLFKIENYNGFYYACTNESLIYKLNFDGSSLDLELLFALQDRQINDFVIFQNHFCISHVNRSDLDSNSVDFININTKSIVHSLKPEGYVSYWRLFNLYDKNLIITSFTSLIITEDVYFSKSDTVAHTDTTLKHMILDLPLDFRDVAYFNDDKVYYLSGFSTIIVKSDSKLSTRKSLNYFTIKPYRRADVFYTSLTALSDYDSKGNLFATGSRSIIFKSSDDGNSWNIAYPLYKLPPGIAASRDRTIFSNSIFHLEDKTYLLIDQGDWQPYSYSVVSNDYGKNWEIDTSIGGISYSKKNVEEAIIFRKRVRSRPHIASINRTQDAGKSWQALYSLKPDTSYSSIGASERTNYGDISYNEERLLVGLQNNSRLWVSYDDGNTFTDSVVYNEDSLFCVAKKMKFKNANGIIFGLCRVIFYSTDNGFTWKNYNLDGSIFMTGGDFIDDSTFIIVTSERKLLLFNFNTSSLINFGELDYTKRTEMLGTSFELKAVNDSTLFFMGDDLIKAKIIRDVGSSVEYKTDERISNYFFLSINPGPVHSTAYINLYGVSMADMSDFQVEVVDMFGSKVMDISDLAIKNSVGYTSEFTADFSNLTQGVYFLKMSSGGSFKTKKFFKLNQ